MLKSLSKQKGFTLVEVGIVVIILTLLTAAKIQSELTDLRFSLAKAQGQQIKVLNEGVYDYGTKNFSAVVNNTPVPGVAVTRAPTVAELNALGYLNGTFSANNYYGSGYVASITPAPAACPADSTVRLTVLCNWTTRAGRKNSGCSMKLTSCTLTTTGTGHHNGPVY